MTTVIRVIGQIDEQAFRAFSAELADAEEADSDVLLELSSEGGSGYDALAFWGRIRNSPVHITCRAYGVIMSAATLVFAACDTREIDSAAWFMVHEDSGRVKGNTTEISNSAAHLEQLEQQWAELLAERSNVPANVWLRMSNKTTYLTPKQLFQYGLADTILKGKACLK